MASPVVSKVDPDPYWKTVEDCLVELHQMKRGEAQTKLSELRLDLDSLPYGPDRELFYHAEQFDVACNLAGRQIDRQANEDAYNQIVGRHYARLQPQANVSRTTMPQFQRGGFSLAPVAHRITKPWGYEILLSPPDAAYALKLIHVNAGKRMSLQVHDSKVETQTLISGRGIIVLEDEQGELHDVWMVPNVGYQVAVGQRHRLCAALASFKP